MLPQEKSLPRPQFKGTLVFDELKGTRVRVFTTSQRATKLMVTIPIVLLSLLVVIVVVFLCLILQVSVQIKTLLVLIHGHDIDPFH